MSTKVKIKYVVDLILEDCFKFDHRGCLVGKDEFQDERFVYPKYLHLLGKELEVTDIDKLNRTFKYGGDTFNTFFIKVN